MSAAPPHRALRLLVRVLRDDPAGPAMLGDLQEDFARISRAHGAAAARRWYWREALLLAAGRLPHRARRTSSRGWATGALVALRALLHDGGYALRTLRHHAGFGLFTAGVIGLGVGAATSVFSVVKPLILAPLPFADPEALVWIANDGEPNDNSLSAVTSRAINLRDFRARTRSFDGLTGYNAFFDQSFYTLTGVGEPERLVGVGVAHDFLDVLGVQPLHGRTFSAEEGAPGGPRAVILSHGFWVRRFAADLRVVGRTVSLNDVSSTVVGVLPPTFDFHSVFSPGARVDFLLPFRISGEPTAFQGNILAMIGRLLPGVSPEAAQAELDAVMAALREEEPQRWGLAAAVTLLQQHVAGPFRGALLLLAAAAGTILLIVCVNVSNLVLARSPIRAREVALRKALGASRVRLARQLVLEMLGISAAGAALGCAVSWGVTGLVGDAAGVRIPLLGEVRVDGPALLFASVVAVLTGLVVALVPALQVAEGGEASALREGGRGSGTSPRARRLRETLVVAEVTLACVLLVVVGLFVRSFQAVLDVDLGFDPGNVVAWQLNPSADFASLREKSDFFAVVAERVAAVPGVDAVGLIDALPLGRNRTWPFSVVGLPQEEATDLQIFPHVVDPGYLAAMRIPLVEGRGFSRDDTGDSQPVILMNRSGALRAFGGERALRRRVRLFGPREWEVVGIVEDVRHLSPEMEPGIQVYLPIAQMADFGSLDLAVRSTLPVEQLSGAVSAALAELDPGMPTREFWTVGSTVDRAVSARRFTLAILAAYGSAALLLAALGVYGVLSQAVAERRGEIGIRMALGASSGEIVWSVMGRTLRLTTLGILAGAALSLMSTRVLESLLFEVSARDPVTFASIALVLLVAATLGAAVPAVRAGRTRTVGVLSAD